MNLKRLFQIQKELDDAIIEKKGLQGRDLLPERILALQVELGECANEWRGFKFWSEDREPRTKIAKPFANDMRGDGYIYQNSLLEEYVDCLHFILSIGLELNMLIVNIWIDSDYTEEDTTATFNKLFSCVSEILETADYGEYVDLVEIYEITFNLFVGLGEKLGFTWEEVERAYLAKNEINHKRQETGY
ncbi:MAG: dUTPase [Shouchella clausii]|jgi:dimeric dUTPase (all-alpha-NTP-PPase superfamily)